LNCSVGVLSELTMFRKKSKFGPTCQSGSEAQQGRRSTMEDTHVHFDDVSKKYGLPEDTTHAFYGVYDGHGGRHAAELAETFLHECVLKSDELKKKEITDDEILNVIRGAYLRTDSVILQRSRTELWNDGCTVVSVLVWGSKLYIGNLGDAEAVIGRKKGSALTAECVTLKHKPNQPDERERIEKAGGHVVFGRVLGSLAVSRAFGDGEMKVPRNRADAHFVSNEPYLQTVAIDHDVPFMIIACDGLWDKVEYQEAVDFIENTRKNNVSPTDAAKMLVRKALEAGTLDNVSVVIVYFNW